MSSHETQLSELQNFIDASVSKLSSQLNLSLQQKTEFSDLETMAHQLNNKLDYDKFQELVAELKQQMVLEISNVKKDVKKKAVKKKTTDQNTVREQEFANEKLFEEIRTFKDKLTKLASQFDKELVERDKALKQYQAGLWDDIQSMLQSIQEDTQSTNKLCQSLANMKADKKELNEFRAKIAAQVQEMVPQAEFTATASNLNSDITQKLLDLRSEIFSRVSELNTQTMDVVA